MTYAITAIILLPINSAMNPLLYSDILDVLWVKLWPASSIMEKLDNGMEMMKDKLQSHKSMSVESVQPSSGEGGAYIIYIYEFSLNY